MDFLDLLKDFLENPKLIEKPAFRDDLYEKLPNIIKFTHGEMHRYLNGMEGSNPALNLDVLAMFFKQLDHEINIDFREGIDVEFEEVFGEPIFNSVLFINSFLGGEIHKYKVAIEAINSQDNQFSINEYAKIFYLIFQVHYTEKQIQSINGISDLNKSILSLFAPVFTEHLAKTLETYLHETKSSFFAHANDDVYLNNVKNIFQNFYHEGKNNNALFSDICREYGKLDHVLETRLCNVLNQIRNYGNDVVHRVYQPYWRSIVEGDSAQAAGNITDFINSHRLRVVRDKSKEGNSKDQAESSHDSDIHNMSDLTIQDFADDIARSEYEVFETSYIKRLQKENQKRMSEAYKESQSELNKQLAKVSQPGYQTQEFIYAPHEEMTLEQILQKSKNHSFQVFSIPLKAYEVSNMIKSAKAQGNVIQLFIPQEQVLRATGTEGFVNTGRRGFRVVGSNNNISPRNAVVKPGPGYITPMSPLGKVAGGYIGVFIVLPQATKDLAIIASPRTEIAEKGTAFLDLGFIAGSAWVFTKFIAKKYPKTAAAIMVGTAGQHIWDSTQPLLRELEKGQRGMTIIFTNEKAMLEAGVSCTDGRRVEFLNPAAAKYLPNKKQQ